MEKTYGAAYGGLEGLHDLPPDYSLPQLDASAWKEISRLHSMPFTLASMNRPALLLGAASGLQLAPEPTLVFQDKNLPPTVMEALRNQLRNCFGLHVGSYHNRVFKRFMYSTGLPIVIFMTSDKINTPIEVGKCHFILDREYRWEKFAAEHPVAFCIGCETADKSKYVEMFHGMNFDVIDQNNSSSVSAFVARNESFINAFERATA